MKALSRRAALGLFASAAFVRAVRAEPRVLIDSVGRQVAAPEKVSRVLAAGPPASILIYALAPDAMIGWVPQPSADAKAFLLQSVRDLPASGRLTSRGETPDLEKIKAEKPDLIVDFGSIGSGYVSLAEKVQGGTHIPYALLDGRLDKLPASLRLGGDFLGRRERAEGLAAYAEQTLRQLDERLAKVPAERRPKVFVARGPDGLQSAVKGSALTEVVERAGAINVAEGTPGRGGAIEATPAQIAAWKPDFILALDKRAYDAMHKVAPSGARVLGAPTLPWNWLGEPPSLNRLMGLRWLTAALYPGGSKTELRTEAREFHRLFYGVTPSDAQLDALLDGSG
jgi:iron complex transport system substrate-binding protein